MRSKVQVWQNSPVANSSGGRDDNYSLIFETRGQLRVKSSTKILEDGQKLFGQSLELVVRYQGKWGLLNTDTILLINGESYKISSSTLKNQIKDELIFKLEACHSTLK